MKISTKSFFSKLKSKSKALDNRESRLRRKQERLFKKAQDRRVTVSDFFGQDNEESAGATIKATMSNPLKIAESISKQKVTPRAEGGPIEEGKPYLVGEEGPEIIIPSKSGNVVSNDKLGIFSIKRLNPNDLSKDALIKKSFFNDNVQDIEISNESGSDYFRKTTDMSTGGLSETTVERTRFTETAEDGTVTVFDKNTKMTEKIVSIGVPDLIEHQDQLLGEIHKLKGFENVTIDQVINQTTGIPQEKLLPILMRSDAQKATDEKEDKAFEEDRKARGIKSGQGFSISPDDEVAKSLKGTIGYRIGQINPDMLVSSMTNLREETKVVSKTDQKPKTDSLFADLSASINASTKGYNEGGLVQPKTDFSSDDLSISINQGVGKNRTFIQPVIKTQIQTVSQAVPMPISVPSSPKIVKVSKSKLPSSIAKLIQ